ncbi:SDH family Clp fold serine proteinase [Candidatus Poriferisodalis sp.]|uniref:SDH family Clp fold serine proteinase n=1 Tax=Candidatus Poriferisodalis sp. TaxID=3101277 RepID=UPI003B51847F
MSDEVQPDGVPSQSAFFRASEAARYARQAEIRAYEDSTGRALVVFWGPILSAVVTPFADAIKDVRPGQPLDLMLTSLGGDAKAALRIATMCHAERDDFRVVVPDTAASAATLLALASEAVVMSDTSASALSLSCPECARPHQLRGGICARK